MQPILAHGGGLDEFLLIIGLVGLPLLGLALLARRIRPQDHDKADGEDALPVE